MSELIRTVVPRCTPSSLSACRNDTEHLPECRHDRKAWMFRVTAALHRTGNVVRNGLHLDTEARDREILTLLADESIGQITITRLETPK